MSVTVATVDDLEAVAARLAAQPAVPKLALTVPEAQQATGAGRDTIRRWIADGLLPRVPHTERVLIPTVALEAFVLAGASTSSGGRTTAPAGEADGPAGSTVTPSPSQVTPLNRADRTGPTSTASPGASGDAA